MSHGKCVSSSCCTNPKVGNGWDVDTHKGTSDTSPGATGRQ